MKKSIKDYSKMTTFKWNKNLNSGYENLKAELIKKDEEDKKKFYYVKIMDDPNHIITGDEYDKADEECLVKHGLNLKENR